MIINIKKTNKLIIFFIINIILLSNIPVIAESHYLNVTSPLLEINDEILCSEPVLINYGEGYWLKLNETKSYIKEKGTPHLPKITKIYQLPFGSIVTNISCEPDAIFTKILNESEINEDTSSNLNNKAFPELWYSYDLGVGLNGSGHVTYLIVHFFPVRYFSVNSTIQYTNILNVTIKYEEGTLLKTVSDRYDLVIISPKIFSKKLNQLVEHKEKMGFKTKLVTVNEIYARYDGIDKAEKIKKFIRYSIEEWGASYALLVGGMRNQLPFSWHIPVRYSHLDDGSKIESKFISDLYYSDIYKYDSEKGYVFDNWNSNNNDIYAEWNINNKDELDLYPDIYLGRLACRNIFEVIIAVNKIIEYETVTKGDWFENFAVIGGDTIDEKEFNLSSNYSEGQLATEKAISYMSEFEPIRIWSENGDVNLSTNNIKKVLNQGQGFVFFSGHSNPRLWLTHPHNDFDNWVKFRIIDIMKIRNKNKLPVLIVGGCNSCQFDVSLMRVLNVKDILKGNVASKCWGWSFVRSPRGGSIATIGSTGLCYGAIGDGPIPSIDVPYIIPDPIQDGLQYLEGWIETSFFKIYNRSQDRILGNIYGKTITDYLNNFPIDWDLNWEDNKNSSSLIDCKMVEEWVLLGDPSLLIRK